MEFAQEVLLLKEDERLKTTIFLWKWWSVRNKMKKGERGQSSREIVGDVLNMIEDLRKEDKLVPGRSSKPVQQWRGEPRLWAN